MKKRNEIVDVSFEFALLIIDFTEELEKSRKYVVAKQLLKSGTSVGANIVEAQSAESKIDFIHKLKIAHKELLESEYWIKLIKSSSSYPKPEIEIDNKLISLKKLFNRIISTAKKSK